jgi:hypothetical protein
MNSVTLDNERFRPEQYYAFYGVNGAIADSFNPGRVWKLQEIRAHLSVPFVSAEVLLVRVSSVLGSQYNVVLHSANLSNTQDLFLHYSEPLLFLSGDQLVFELSMVSGTNVIGLQFNTWAARG